MKIKSKNTMLLILIIWSINSYSQLISSDSLNSLFNEAKFHCTNPKGDSILGIKLSNEYISNDTNSSAAYYNRGLAYHRNRQYVQAIKDYKKSFLLNKNHDQALFMIGRGYFDMDKYRIAIKYFDSTLTINPIHLNSNHYLGHSYLKLGDYKKALKFYNKVLEIDNKNYKAFVDRGFIYYILKSYDLALKDYETAISINNSETEVYEQKTMVYLRLEQPDKAISTLNTAKKISSSPNLDYLFGLAYVIKGNKKEACRYFKLASDRNFQEAIESYKEYCR